MGFESVGAPIGAKGEDACGGVGASRVGEV